MNYGWKRFWCPRDENYLVTDTGYLSDPTNEHAKAVVVCPILIGNRLEGQAIKIKQVYVLTDNARPR